MQWCLAHTHVRTRAHTHTHTHTHPFNGFFWATQVSRYQKGKTNLDFTEARDSDISWVICKSAPCSRQTTIPTPHHSFYRPDALPAAQPTASKHWRPICTISNILNGTELMLITTAANSGYLVLLESVQYRCMGVARAVTWLVIDSPDNEFIEHGARCTHQVRPIAMNAHQTRRVAHSGMPSRSQHHTRTHNTASPQW